MVLQRGPYTSITWRFWQLSLAVKVSAKRASASGCAVAGQGAVICSDWRGEYTSPWHRTFRIPEPNVTLDPKGEDR